jgi:hypothetical protein
MINQRFKHNWEWYIQNKFTQIHHFLRNWKDYQLYGPPLFLFIYLCPVKFSFELSNEIIGLIINNVEKLKEFEDIYKVAYLFI